MGPSMEGHGLISRPRNTLPREGMSKSGNYNLADLVGQRGGDLGHAMDQTGDTANLGLPAQGGGSEPRFQAGERLCFNRWSSLPSLDYISKWKLLGKHR